MSDSLVKYYVYGTISGCTGVIISHPFDTIKTCIQENKVLNLSTKSLYKGLIPPLIGVGLEKAFVFGTYNSVIKIFNLQKDIHSHNFLAGLISGFSASLIVTPFERLKILKQTDQSLKNLNIRNLYSGLSATFTREIPGFGIYFTVFNNNKKYYQPNTFYDFVNGGITGIIAWIFIYPQDRIKTKIQINKEKHLSFKESFNEIIKEGGIKQFYKGFPFALYRAVPLHAGTFCAFEYLNKSQLLE
jgi:solute carrier family 25 carnitine/acylcarnitine transporter 20/29